MIEGVKKVKQSFDTNFQVSRSIKVDNNIYFKTPYAKLQSVVYV